jgi:hypothetical protein
VAVQERNAAAALGYLDVALGGRLIERIEVDRAVHEAPRGQGRGEIEQARVVPWIRTSPARIHALSPFGSNGLAIEAVARNVWLSGRKVLGTNLNCSESCLGIRWWEIAALRDLGPPNVCYGSWLCQNSSTRRRRRNILEKLLI